MPSFPNTAEVIVGVIFGAVIIAALMFSGARLVDLLRDAMSSFRFWE